MRADVERAAQAVRTAAVFEWTWTVNDLQPFCDGVGWELSGLEGGSPGMTTNLDVNRPDVLLYVKAIERPDASRTLNQISYRVSDVVLDRTDLQPELDEVFDALAQRVFEMLGKRPTDWWIEPTRGLRWDFQNIVVTTTISATSVYVDLVNPAYQQWHDEIENSGDDD
ncbi:DUF6301 family protein [Nocardia sp. NPDC052566]|uniref:DUF6301 family protein n=1 Tax=Nocardia sp. NPDC052566 TaxID=3364330 RepID=UPI0037CB0B92